MEFNEENFYKLEAKVAVLEAKMAFVFKQLAKVHNAEDFYDLESVDSYFDEDDQWIYESFGDDVELNDYFDWGSGLGVDRNNIWYQHPRQETDVPEDTLVYTVATDRNPRRFFHDDRAIQHMKLLGWSIEWDSHEDLQLIGKGFYQIKFTLTKEAVEEARERIEAWETEGKETLEYYKAKMLADLDKPFTVTN